MMLKTFKFIATVILTCVFTTFVFSQSASTITCSQSNFTVTNISGTGTDYGDMRWPVAESNIIFNDAFGSRTLSANTNNYDFHRGIDFKGNEGDPIYAIADGTVTKVQANCTSGTTGCSFPSGGNVVVIQHTLASDKAFPFNSRSFTTYYSVYLHLKDFIIDANGNTLTTGSITKGQQIGHLGQTDANYPHLHFEIRVGTLCSGEAQSKSGSCYQTLGLPVFDPSVNPLYFFEYVSGIYENNNNYGVCVTTSPNLKVQFESPRNELDFNEIEVIYSGGSKKVNFSLKDGINLTNVDTNPYNDVKITPSDFTATTANYGIAFDFTNLTNYQEIYLRDIWGNGKKIVPNP
ncbi:MAG TPA: M23 family metallopeptidase [Nostocaceae cyanobacterium]|nr:M23 family metallopeptidase [Nostocaceae cyanobacterium]